MWQSVDLERGAVTAGFDVKEADTIGRAGKIPVARRANLLNS
jgi:hypothetical protein